MSSIEERIAEVLRNQGVGDECRVDWTRADRLASVLVAKFDVRPRYKTGPDIEMDWAET